MADPVAKFTNEMKYYWNRTDDMVTRIIANWMVRHDELTRPVVEVIVREKSSQADDIMAGLHDQIVEETRYMEEQLKCTRKAVAELESFVARGKALSE